MQTFNHKIGEKFTLLTNYPTTNVYKVMRVIDGKAFNRSTSKFEVFNPLEPNSFYFPLFQHQIEGLTSSEVYYLPEFQMDLVFEFLQPDIDGNYTPFAHERHLFGGFRDKDTPKLCVVYGTIYDPTGAAVKGARIDATLNRQGMFIDKTPMVSPTAYAVTDDAGYFELPLMQGINVSINIPAIGFCTNGYVPMYSSVKLSPYCLLRERR